MKVKFGDVLYIKGRIGWQLLKKHEYLSSGDYYLVTGVDITDTHRINFDQCYFVSKERYEMDDKIQLRVGDIIVTKDGTIGKIGIIDKLDKPATLNSHLFLIRNERTDILDTNYLFQILRSESFQKFASNNTSGSNIPAFTQANITNFEIDLPPLEEQIEVSKTLKDIDEKIINNDKIIAELESMAKTLYDYWFLQFEFPNEEGKPYKSSGGKMVYNEELKREIPGGWEVSELLDLVDWITNSQPPKSDFKYLEEPGYVRFIQNRDYDSSNHVTYIPFKKSLNIVDRLDILMDKYGDAGVVRYGLSGAFNVALAHIKPKNNFMREYIRSVLLSNSMYTYFHNSCMASTRASLSEENLKKVYVIVPPKEILFNYEKKLSSMRNMILKMQDENQELSSLRDFLLPMLMNGQVTFK